MLISVFCRYRDDCLAIVDDQYVDLRQAVGAALDLADFSGEDKGNGSGPPKSFDVCIDGDICLSVAVLRGGMLGRPGVE
jgi:hypothetical protein